MLSNRLSAIVAEWSLLKHRFYRAWNEGALSLDSLRRYAAQYSVQVHEFPRFVSAVHSRCPQLDARKVLTENLCDEEIHDVDHPELWLRFCDDLGLSREAVAAETPLPETAAMVRVFRAICDGDWRDGLCALFAYERQVPEVSASKIDGLKRFYGIEQERALSFFRAHQTYDVVHLQKLAALIDRYGRPGTAEEATQRAASALWGFLDGIARETGIECGDPDVRAVEPSTGVPS